MPPLDNPQRAAPALAGGIGQPAPVRDRRRLPVAGPLLVGPAVLAATAYMDPGNFAMNIAAGSRFDYRLLWVVLAGNLIAMLLQALSAKLGIATGRNLAELCRDRLPPAAVWPMWVVSELAAMATDLAELVGGAIGLSLLFGIPLLPAMAVVGVATYAILLLDRAGFRWLEILIGGFVVTIGLCYVVELIVAPVAWGQAAAGMTVPAIPPGGLPIAVGIIGATVMPHALYLHSGLMQARLPAGSDDERRKAIRLSNREVRIALGIAGAINLAMVIMAAAAFDGSGGVDGIAAAYRLLGPLLGPAAAAAFLVSLIASGISSSAVGTLAGQIVMQGFVGFRIPVWVRRLATMLPAFAVVAAGADTTTALVASQIVLSLALPVPMIALVAFTSRRSVMGACVNARLTTAAATAATVLVLALNVVLLLDLPGSP